MQRSFTAVFLVLVFWFSNCGVFSLPLGSGISSVSGISQTLQSNSVKEALRSLARHHARALTEAQAERMQELKLWREAYILNVGPPRDLKFVLEMEDELEGLLDQWFLEQNATVPSLEYERNEVIRDELKLPFLRGQNMYSLYEWGRTEGVPRVIQDETEGRRTDPEWIVKEAKPRVTMFARALEAYAQAQFYGRVPVDNAKVDEVIRFGAQLRSFRKALESMESLPMDDNVADGEEAELDSDDSGD